MTSAPYRGRVYDFTVHPDHTLWANGILVHNCGPCSLVDGHRYGSVAGGLVDYPNGIYGHCDGGPRCRGTLVFTWQEASPSVR